MKIVVIGGLGFIGLCVVMLFSEVGYVVFVVLLCNGVNLVIGEGLSDVFIDVDVVVDVMNVLLWEL